MIKQFKMTTTELNHLNLSRNTFFEFLHKDSCWFKNDVQGSTIFVNDNHI